MKFPKASWSVTPREAAAKRESKERDAYHCRWPAGCTVSGIGRVESAHIDGKGMGGDHGIRSSLRSDYVTFCREHHRMVDEHKVRLIVGPQRGDGPIEVEPWNIGGGGP